MDVDHIPDLQFDATDFQDITAPYSLTGSSIFSDTPISTHNSLPTSTQFFDITSESSYTSYSSSLSKQSSPGRKKNRFTLILENFFTSNARHPKKEFFNAFVIRSLKRSFRYIEQKRVPSRTCIAVNFTFDEESRIWAEMEKLYKSNPQQFKKISATETSPQTDGKAKRKMKKIKTGPKSFNNQYCKEFFSDENMQKAFFIFIQLIFCNSSSAKLRTRFKFDCCKLKYFV